MRWILTLILTAVCLKLFLPMRASGSGRTEYVGPKWRLDRRGIGTECKGCRRLFSSTFAFDQHRRSPAVRNTACFSLHDENRINVTAVSRANMSTAAVERRPAKRTRGGHVDIFDILNVFSVTKIFSNRAYPLRVPPV